MVEQLEETGELEWGLTALASRPAPDPEVIAQAQKESAERDQRFSDLHAELDSGKITQAEWNRRFTQMVRDTTPA
jgi:hypothetical protein